MKKETHWLLDSLNNYIHACEYSKEEIKMWRDLYIKEHLNNATDYEKNVFLSIPSIYFESKSPKQVFDEKCKELKG